MITTSIVLTHTAAVHLHRELTAMLADNNLDTLQIVTTSTDIHVTRLGEPQNEIPHEMD